METLWSISTTIREAERITDFVRTAKEMEGEIWDKKNSCKFQILLIKNRLYLNSGGTQGFEKLNQEQINLLKNPEISMSYEQAEDIFNTKKYEDPTMRGRQSMSPLVKLGLVDKSQGIIKITDAGNKLINGQIHIDEFMFDSFVKLQYPNPIEDEHENWDTKPFLNTLRLIKKVNEMCIKRNIKDKGITKIEFGIFVLSLKSYKDIDLVAKKIIDFRLEFENIKDSKKRNEYVKDYISSYLSEFKNPHKNVKEYTDNMIRYLRITKYIYLRGKYEHTCIDIEPRRMVEVNSLLDNDIGCSKQYTKEEWIKYYGTYGSYPLPFENKEKLKEIANSIVQDLNNLEKKIGFEITKTFLDGKDKDELKAIISEKRAYRVRLQNLEIKIDYNNNLEKIDETIDALKNIKNLDLKPSIALEKWTNIALNIINDSDLIKPNSIVGDDNEPTFTAPAGVADIECFYKTFNAICEVTMLTGRDQWHNEGQPIMRHLNEFEEKNTGVPAYCLFIAPKLHEDAIETFFMGVRFKYKGKKLKIVPITINQLIEMLVVIKKLKQNKKEFKHYQLKDFYDRCTSFTDGEDDSRNWINKIDSELKTWTEELLT